MEFPINHSPAWQKTAAGDAIELWNRCGKRIPSKNYLFIGGVHGDEPEGVALAKTLLELLRSSDVDAGWTLIPCLNPEGFRAGTRVNSRGVDLNRNFPTADWSAAASADRYHPGAHPASESETRGLVQLLSSEKFDVLFHFHSWKPEIILTGPENLSEAVLLSEASGHPVKLDIGYPTPGSIGQYGWYEKKIPVVCIEEEEKISQAASWAKFGPGFRKILGIDS